MEELTIKTEHPGAIPIGAKLVHFTKWLEMAGTHIADFGGAKTPVHPLTISLPEETVLVLDQHQDINQWKLVSYNEGVTVIKPLPDAEDYKAWLNEQYEVTLG